MSGDAGVPTEATQTEGKKVGPYGERAYIFDPKWFDAKTEMFTEGLSGEQKEKKLKSMKELREWAQKYSGQIPKDWVDVPAGPAWPNVVEASFENLTDTQKLAMLEYPDLRAPMNATRDTKLKPLHLFFLAKLDHIPDGAFSGMMSEQLTRGADPKLIERAKKAHEQVLTNIQAAQNPQS